MAGVAAPGQLGRERLEVVGREVHRGNPEGSPWDRLAEVDPDAACGLPPKVTSSWRMLFRTPIAVIQRQGPSIRHVARFDVGVRNRYQPKRTSRSPSSSTHALSRRTPKSIRTGHDRRPTRIGKRTE